MRHDCVKGGRATHQPTPSATLDSGCFGIELLLECFDGAKIAFDESLEWSTLELSTLFAGWSQVLPEQRMVDVSYSKGVSNDVERVQLCSYHRR